MKVVLFHIRPRTDIDMAAYEAASQDMLTLASEMPGFLGIDGFTGEDGSELAIVRFESDDTLRAWREHPEHRRMQQRGRAEFFAEYQITVADVDREYGWTSSPE